MSKKLLVGIKNSQDRVPSSFFWSFIYLLPVPGVHILVKRSPAPRAPVRHNQLFKFFLKTDCDYFVEMDVDQVYPPDYYQKMVPLIDEYKAIGPLIFDRQESNNFMPLVFSDADVDRFTATPISITGKSGIIEVGCCHANLFLAREVVEKLEWPPYPGLLSDDGLSKRQHADFLFNKKVKEAGYKLYVNLDVEVGHIAEFPITRKRWGDWNERKRSEKQCELIPNGI